MFLLILINQNIEKFAYPRLKMTNYILNQFIKNIETIN